MAGRIMSMKNFNDIIGNRTRDLLACSTVPQPTAPPRDTGVYYVGLYKRGANWISHILRHELCIWATWGVGVVVVATVISFY
jgi:hypothetical protein